MQQVRLAQERIKLQHLAHEHAPDTDLHHTPYAELPPPSEQEMREIRARLRRHYDRLRDTYILEHQRWLLSLCDSPYAPP